MTTTKKTLVIYHGNCLDGFGAALAAWCLFGDEADYVPALYGDNPPHVPNREVVIVDFSYKRAVLEQMATVATSLRVFDHHKTAQADLDGFPGAVFDMESSGATLTWKNLMEGRGTFFENMPQLLRHIEDRDLWRFKMHGTRAVCLALAALPRTFEAWNQHLYDVMELLRDGDAMISYQDGLVRQMVEQARWQLVGRYSVPVVNASVCFSEVGDALCMAFPDAPFAAYYFDRADGMRQWGVRSRGGFDVSVVAKMFGGGGHEAAAGWTQKLDPVDYGRG